MKLKDYQAAWHSLLMGESAEKAAEVLKSPVNDLKMYQNFVQHHYASILKKMFRRSYRFLPEESLVADYYRNSPPTKWDLNELTEEFPTFLEEMVQTGDIPLYVKELAEFEYAEFQVYRMKLFPEPNLGRISINPASEVLIFEHDIMSWVHALEKNPDDEFVPKMQSQVLAISRGPKGQCVFTVLGVLSSIIVSTLSEQEAPVEEKDLIEHVYFLIANSPLKDQLQLTKESIQPEVANLKIQFLLI